MECDILHKNDNNRSRHDLRSARDGRSAHYERSAEETFLNGMGRFKRRSEWQRGNASADDNAIVAAPEMQNDSAEKRSGDDRRSGRDRRCGYDKRSEVEQFLQGERRSGIDRRKKKRRQFRSFKKARAFARDLALKSANEWFEYAHSGMRPDDIPVAPHQTYANDGWVGWSDWLGASAVAIYLSQCPPLGMARALLRRRRPKTVRNKTVNSGRGPGENA